MSLNNQDNNNQSFDEGFSEELENFDSDPAVLAATEATSSKSKGGWLVLLIGIVGTGAYLGYRYYLVPHGTTLSSIESNLLPEQHAKNPAEMHAITTENKTVPDTSKISLQAHKNAQFEHLKTSLFGNNGETTKTAVTIPPPPPPAQPIETAHTTAVATAAPVIKNETTKNPAPTVVAIAAPQPAENPVVPSSTTQPAPQLNERLEINIHQIQHLEEVLQGITQTIAKLNTDISTMDSRILALSNSTGNLSTDVSGIKNEMSGFKKALGEEGILDVHVPPPPSHTYLKASQLASSRPKATIPAYVVHAIIPGRAWLKANNGQIMTVTEGDTLGDYGKVLVIDAASGMVLTSSGNTFQ
jgi:hypothetical protein